MLQTLRLIVSKGIDPAFLAGMAGTVAFYAVVLQPAMHGTLLYRYTAEHLVEYVIVALFIWGLADAALKLLGFPRQLWALRLDWLPPRNGREPAANARSLLAPIQARSRWTRESRMGQRLQDALQYVVDHGSVAQYREHLQYLADQDEDQTQANYTLMRFVVGVTPVLGFLGTVVHFGTALSGISFDEMAERLPVIVGEMGAAFNTTTVALAAAMTMMFTLFLCERVERRTLRTIDRFVERELLLRFETEDGDLQPFLSAVHAANDRALLAIGETLQRQVQAWTGALEGLFHRFDERQQIETEAWRAALSGLQQRHDTEDTRRDERLRQSLALVDARQERQLSQIESTLERVAGLRDDFTLLARTLDGLSRGEGRLVELQATLTENLRVLHEARQIDEALHGLTAAIHLLTARHRQAA